MVSLENVQQAEATYKASPSQANYAVYKQLVDKYNAAGQQEYDVATAQHTASMAKYKQGLQEALQDIPQEVTQAGPSAIREYKFIISAYYRGGTDQEKTNKLIDSLYRRHKITGPVDWESIPLKERKYYPGAKEHFAALSNDEKIRAVGTDNINRLIKEYTSKSMTDITRRNRIHQYASTTFKGRDDAVTQAVINVLWEDLTKPEREVKEAYYEKLPVGEQHAQTWAQMARKFFVEYLTFPVTKYRMAADILKKKTGFELPKIPIFTPIAATIVGAQDKYRQWEAEQTIGPTGHITTTGMALTPHIMPTLGYTKQEVRDVETQLEYEKKQQEKYPLQTITATFGEVSGLFAGGKVASAGKAGISKGFSFLTKKVLGKEILLSSLKPTTLLRTARYKIQKTIPEKPLESLVSKSALAGTEYGRVPYAEAIKQFKATKGAMRPGEYAIVHTAPSPLTLLRKRFRIRGSASESPGLSTSPYGQAVPDFWGIEPKYAASYRPTILPKFVRPAMTRFSVRDIVRLPKIARSFKASAKLMKKQPKGPYGVRAPKMEMGSLVEPEAIIWKSTPTQMLGKSGYIMYKGQAIPEYTAKLLSQKITPQWKIGLLRKTRFYSESPSAIPYMASSKNIIAEFVKQTKSSAKKIYEAASKSEYARTGKTTLARAAYQKALKKIDKLAVDKEFILRQYQRPTVFGQLKIKGFKPLEHSGERLAAAFAETPGRTSVSVPILALKVYSLSSKYYKPYKSYVSKPSKPSYPSRPSYKSYPSKSPYYESYKPYKPSYPSYDDYYSYPSYTSYSKPSYPSYPSYRPRPSKPYYPFYLPGLEEEKKRKISKKRKKAPPKYREREFKIKPVKSFKPKMVKL